MYSWIPRFVQIPSLQQLTIRCRGADCRNILQHVNEAPALVDLWIDDAEVYGRIKKWEQNFLFVPSVRTLHLSMAVPILALAKYIVSPDAQINFRVLDCQLLVCNSTGSSDTHSISFKKPEVAIESIESCLVRMGGYLVPLDWKACLAENCLKERDVIGNGAGIALLMTMGDGQASCASAISSCRTAGPLEPRMRATYG